MITEDELSDYIEAVESRTQSFADKKWLITKARRSSVAQPYEGEHNEAIHSGTR